MKDVAAPGAVLERERIAHFRLVDKVGQGGMGVVYKAVDEKLGRTVALKVLRSDRADRGDDRARLMREARAVAALAHPNIAAVYEVDEDDGLVYLAMEWIDGKTLRQAIDGKPMPREDALRIAIAMAEGLARAHEAGIAHRDLKPENVLLTPDGGVKLLDFGLAKTFSARELEQSETVTEEGVILGTPSYMSPEQARGRDIDARSDIFSLGAVLYEMLTGRRAFTGNTTIDTVDAVLHVPIAPVAEDKVPSRVMRVVDKCLNKERAQRYATCAELIDDLALVASGGEPRLARETPLARRRRAAWIAAPALAAAVAAGAWWAWPTGVQPSATRPPTLTPERITNFARENMIGSAAISPDGTRVAYFDSTKALLVRTIATRETLEIPRPPGEVDRIGWFPDGARLLLSIFAGEDPQLWIVPVQGGTATRIPGSMWYAVPSPDGARIAADTDDGIVTIALDGSDRRVIVPGKNAIGPGAWSPDGRFIAFFDRHPVDGLLRVVPAAGGEPWLIVQHKQLVEMHPQNVIWLPDGRLIYPLYSMHEIRTRLWAQAMDPATGRPVDQAVQLAMDANEFVSGLSVTADGHDLLFIGADEARDAYVAPLDSSGTVGEPQRLTFEDTDDYLLGWRANGSLLYTGGAVSAWDRIYEQKPGDPNPRLLVRLPERCEPVRTVPPEQDRVFAWHAEDLAEYEKGVELLSVPLTPGEAPRPLARRVGVNAHDLTVTCSPPPAGRCVFAEYVDGAVEVRSLDATGVGGVLARAEMEHPANLVVTIDPTGSRVVIADFGGRESKLRIASLTDGTMQTVKPNVPHNFYHAAWSHDGRAIYATGGRPVEPTSVLARVELDGTTRLVRSSPGGMYRPFPSPDGRHLAWGEYWWDTDIWMLHGF